MRVLFISEYFPPFSQGGGERSAEKLVKAIQKKGVECSVLTSNKIYQVKDWKRHFYFPYYSIINLWKLHKDYDVIHCLNSTSIYTVLLKPIIKKPFVIHINSYVTLCPKGTLIYKDQTKRSECDIKCSLYNNIDCCSHSSWVGIKDVKHISKIYAFLLWIRYRFHIYLLHRFDKIIAISKKVKDVLEHNELDSEVIYYGA